MFVKYNGTTYQYVTNLQGDVIAILDSSGNAVVEYTYDAWGNILSIGGTLANTLGVHNPLRYRGYVYDTEIGLYYLQSRYYDPEVGRFLNADIVYDTDAGLQGYNLFIYCGNNPINRIDVSGADSTDLIDGDKDDDEQLTDGHSSHSHKSNSSTISSQPSSSVPGRNYSGNSGRTEVHHIVEQCQVNKSGFSSDQIQADSNKVVLDYYLHRKVSAYYSSITDVSEGLRVRNWLAGKSFEEQTQFGWRVINMFYSAIME